MDLRDVSSSPTLPSPSTCGSDYASEPQLDPIHNLNEYIAAIRLDTGQWCECLGDNVDGWPIILRMYSVKASERGTDAVFNRRLHREIKIGKFLLGKLAGIWRLPLPIDEASIRDIWMQMSSLQGKIYGGIACLDHFLL
jgi:hypothetical protein